VIPRHPISPVRGRRTIRVWAAAAAAAAAAGFLTASPAAGAPPIATTRPATRPTTRQATDVAAPSVGDATPAGPNGEGDLSGMSLEDLMNVEVTSVSKQPQKASETPAAVTVIGQDDIARSGLQSVPELLRLVPGMDVAQLNANTWTISTRGFNDVFSNKLQVLNDGRSVYTPGYSGVFWDLQDPLLQDLDRIEVIRGPGATIYGANAVNGVVNITSKSARDTQGTLVTGLLGDYQQEAGIRYGGQIDDRTYYRAYERYQRTDDFPTATGNDGRDGWQGDSAGFRVDRYATADDTFTFQGDAEQNREGQQVLAPTYVAPYSATNSSSFDATGADVLGRWTHRTSDTSELVAQAYYDFVDHPMQLGRYHVQTGDLDVHDRFAVGDRQQVIVGGECRLQQSVFRPGPIAVGTWGSRNEYLVSGFVQDDLTVVRNRVHAIVGTKLEDTSQGGFDVQPSGRLLWTPDDRNTVWASVSRAVGTPGEYERAVRFDVPTGGGGSAASPLPVVVQVRGSNGFESETLAAYEVGYRVKPAASVSLDVSGAYNHYDKLRSFGYGVPSVIDAPVPHVLLPSPLGNDFGADTYAFELAANWQVTPVWRLASSYSLLVPHVFDTIAANPVAAQILAIENGDSPRNQAQLHSYWDVTKRVQLNASAYYVDALNGQGVPSYIRTDVNVAWQPRPGLDLSVGVQNLFDGGHPEFSHGGTTDTLSTEVPRTVYAEATYQF
jgi:iron complex outermembrane receptor protein